MSFQDIGLLVQLLPNALNIASLQEKPNENLISFSDVLFNEISFRVKTSAIKEGGGSNRSKCLVNLFISSISTPQP